jgi:hypothetical protein
MDIAKFRFALQGDAWRNLVAYAIGVLEHLLYSLVLSAHFHAVTRENNSRLLRLLAAAGILR